MDFSYGLFKKKADEEPVQVNVSEFEQLQDILIFEEGENFVKISGEGIQTGHRNDWLIIGSKYCGDFEEFEITS